VNVAAAVEVGGFDESLFIDYVDHEFCLRLRQHGYQVMETTRALLIHSLGALEVRRFGPLRLLITHHSPARRYYMSRNRILVWKKYWRCDPGWLLQDARRLVVEFIGVVVYEKDVSTKLRMALRGFRDALRNVRGELRT
jgi:rhamnosyltransferase